MANKAALLAAVLLQTACVFAGEANLSFNRDIRPILSEYCFNCHGADSASRQADLRLDDRESVISAGIIVAGEADASPLVERIATDDPTVRMPPPEMKHSLSSSEIAIIRRWIDEGAKFERHWAFLPLRRPPIPKTLHQSWPANAIDRFVLAPLEAQGMAPSVRAPLPTLLRRISLDVAGLPPTRKQLAAWQASADPVDAALNELLASPHYGERMAVDWMDVARYADTHGFNNDSLRIMWRWRDWVIDAFNKNMPYDQFISRQLAGDLMPGAELEDIVATAFNRNHVINSEGGIIDEEYRVEYVADRVRTMSLAWLGVTLECARCHDHKFDPFTQRDYYRLFAFFNNIDETGEDGRVGNAAPLMRAPTTEQQAQYEQLTQEDRALKRQLLSLARKIPFHNFDHDKAKAVTEAAILALHDKTALASADDGSPMPEAARDVALTKPIDVNAGWAFTAWVQRDRQAAAPLVSTMDFLPPPSSQGHGRGMQVGFSPDGAVDVRIAVRWPGYSLHVVSQEKVPVGQWRHVTVVGQGTKAEGIRIFVDGIEQETDVLHDDLTGGLGVEKTIQIGTSSEKKRASFVGRLQRLRLVAGKLSEEELDQLLIAEMLHGPSTSELSTGILLARAAVGDVADGRIAQLYTRWKSLRQKRLEFGRGFPTVMIVRELTQPRDTFVLTRGQYDRPGEQVEPGVPEAFGLPLPPDMSANRLALAAWLTDRRHPLTSRVVVNRLWHSMFGVGLVKTVEDLGTRGDLPSHPALLDWLACELIESGWDMKQMVRMIIESSTYQQDSSASPDAWSNDPENRLLARGPRQRLTAEMIRDQALSAAGLLSTKQGGPPVFPWQPPNLYKGIVVEAGYPGTTYEPSTGEDQHRRSLYTFWKRTVPHPTLSTFDAPDREFCTARRTVTNTPLQALVLMNDPIFLEASLGLAKRMLGEGGRTEQSRIAWAFEMLTARRPKEDELATLVSLLHDQRAQFMIEKTPPRGIVDVGSAEFKGVEDPAELAAYANLASLLLNLDESLTRN